MNLPKDFNGMPGYVIDLLTENGYDTIEKLRAASDDELLAINGVGASRVANIRSFIETVDIVSEVQESIWVWGLRFKPGKRGFSYCDFKPGVCIESLRFNSDSKTIGVLLTAPGIKEREELDYIDAKKKYPQLFDN